MNYVHLDFPLFLASMLYIYIFYIYSIYSMYIYIYIYYIILYLYIYIILYYIILYHIILYYFILYYIILFYIYIYILYSPAGSSIGSCSPHLDVPRTGARDQEAGRRSWGFFSYPLVMVI